MNVTYQVQLYPAYGTFTKTSLKGFNISFTSESNVKTLKAPFLFLDMNPLKSLLIYHSRISNFAYSIHFPFFNEYTDQKEMSFDCHKGQFRMSLNRNGLD